MICVEDIRGTDCGLSEGKTNRLMMSDAVAQYIDAVKFVDHESVVILALRGGARFVRKNLFEPKFGLIVSIRSCAYLGVC